MFDSLRLVEEDGKYKTDSSMTLKPPYRVAWDDMAKYAALGERQRITVEMVNKWIVVPKFAHLLIAAQKNKPLVEVAKDEEVHRRLLYAMRHHVHNHSAANIAPHPCMTMIYNFPDSRNACLPTSADHSVIHASLYLAEVVNAALTDKSLSNSQTKELVLEEVAKELGNKLSSLSHRAGTADVGKITKGLGEHLSLQKHFTFCKFNSAIHTHALQRLDSYFFSCRSSSILVLRSS